MNRELAKRFGTSPRLELLHGDWLQRGLGAKTVKFDIGQGGLPPEVTWEDKSAAIGLIKNKTAKHLASLLVWGSNEGWDWSESFNAVVDHLAKRMLIRCAEDMRPAPKGGNHSLEELARLMARMTLHFELYQLWTLYTVEGRLLFSGIKVPANSYRQIWTGYQDKILDDLESLVDVVNRAIADYRFNLKSK